MRYRERGTRVMNAITERHKPERQLNSLEPNERNVNIKKKEEKKVFLAEIH